MNDPAAPLHYVAEFPGADPAPTVTTRLGPMPRIHPSCSIVDSHLGPWTDLMAHCSLVESRFDAYSYAAGQVSIIYTDVGRFCSIAAQVRINPGNHPMDRVTQHHMTYRRASYGFGDRDDEDFFQWRRNARCRIGHDVWIGHGAIVLPGVSVGTGAVIGAGAVVSRDVGPYEIAVGVPARSIRTRFDDATIDKLLGIAWWNWDRDTLATRFAELNDVRAFVEKYAY